MTSTSTVLTHPFRMRDVATSQGPYHEVVVPVNLKMKKATERALRSHQYRSYDADPVEWIREYVMGDLLTWFNQQNYDMAGLHIDGALELDSVEEDNTVSVILTAISGPTRGQSYTATQSICPLRFLFPDEHANVAALFEATFGGAQ